MPDFGAFLSWLQDLLELPFSAELKTLSLSQKM